MPTVTKKASPKKTSTKKVVAKKSLPKKTPTTKKSLVYAENSKSFWTKDGQIFNSLLALHAALAKMDKDVYVHHVTKDRHDFAQWVKDVLCDDACAADLLKAKTPTSAKTVVAKHLKFYQY